MNALTSMLLAVLIYSFFPLAASFGVHESTPILFIMLTTIFGLIQTLLVVGLASRLMGFSLIGLGRDITSLPLPVLWIGAISGTTANLGNILFAVALSVMSKAGATIIMESWPLFAMFLAPLIIEKTWEKTDPLDVLLALAAMAGIAVITLPEAHLTIEQFLSAPSTLVHGADIITFFGVITALMGSVCFSLCGTFRAQFINKLPKSFKAKYDKGNYALLENIIGEAVSKVFYFPIITVAFLAMELDGRVSSPKAYISGFMVGAILVAVEILYSLALIKASRSTINIVWYFAPLLAVIWLIAFGQTELSKEIVIGGSIIFGVNMLLGLKNRNRKPAMT